MTKALRQGVAPLLVGLAVVAVLRAAGSAEPGPATGLDVIVVDAGHGGADYGARAASGLREKDVVLKVARRIGAALEQEGLRVVYTRTDDRFVSLPERTAIANRAHADLYLSIHANASDDPAARGPETYFLSLEASDDEARRVAAAENSVFDRAEAVPDSGDVVGHILSDLIRTEHLRGSSEIAMEVQRELERLPGPGGRGVKQAPFVVLMGVNMPAALLEVGFLTNPEEARALQSKGHQQAIARAVRAAVAELRSRRAAASPGEMAD